MEVIITENKRSGSGTSNKQSTSRTRSSGSAGSTKAAAKRTSAAGGNTASARRTASSSTRASAPRQTSAARPASSRTAASGQSRQNSSRQVSGSVRRPSSGSYSSGQRARSQQRSSYDYMGDTYAARSQRQEKRRNPLMIAMLAALGIVLVAVIILGIYAMQYANYDKILPNVYVQGIDVGGMTKEEAKTAIENAVDSSSQQSVNVILPDCTLTFSADTAAVTLDVDEAVEEAYNYGRNSSSPFAMARAIKTAQRHRNDINITSATTVDQDYIRQMIDAQAASVSTEKTESTVDIDQDNHIITVIIGTPGCSLDTDTLFTLVCNAFSSGDYSDIDFDYTMSYPATIALDRLYEQMTTEAQNAYYDSESGSVMAESVGYTPSTDLETANSELSLASPGDVLVFRFDETQPEITQADLEAVLFQDTLYSYGTVYASNAGRTENLRLACAAIDGTVIQPGEVFSFNDTVGERTAEKGYQEAVVYVNGNSESALGGGICQVASTIYYCCMYADLEIVEREEHMYFVTYVPGGLDATVYWGTVDFKFRNSTDYPLRIDAYLSGGMVNIALVGTDVNHYDVEIENTLVSTTPYSTVYESGSGSDVSGYTGYVYTITRNIYDSDGNLIRSDSTEDLDAMGYGCGTSTYQKRDQVIYSGGSYSYDYTAPTQDYYDYSEPSQDYSGGGDAGDAYGGGDTGGGDAGGADTVIVQ